MAGNCTIHGRYQGDWCYGCPHHSVLRAEVLVERSPGSIKKHRVRLKVEHQSFTFDYYGTKEECEWYAKMIRVALGKLGVI